MIGNEGAIRDGEGESTVPMKLSAGEKVQPSSGLPLRVPAVE